MDIALLITALALVGIGVDILRFPKQPQPTQQQDDEVIFGKSAAEQMRRIYTGDHSRYGGVPRSAEMRAIAAILLVAGLVLGAKAIEMLWQ
jgi:hypothetical protein